MTRYITEREWMSPTFEARRPALPDEDYEAVPVCERCGEEHRDENSAYCGDCEPGSDWHRAHYADEYCDACGEHDNCVCPEAA